MQDYQDEIEDMGLSDEQDKQKVCPILAHAFLRGKDLADFEIIKTKFPDILPKCLGMECAWYAGNCGAC